MVHSINMKSSFATVLTFVTALSSIQCQSTSSASFSTLTLPTSKGSADGLPNDLPGVFWPWRRGLTAANGPLGKVGTAASANTASFAPQSLAGSAVQGFTAPASATLGSAGSLPLPSTSTVVVGTISSQVVSETFVPFINSEYTTLRSTTTILSLNSQSSPVPVVIWPGGVAWTPVSESSSAPVLPLPTIPPSRPDVTPTRPNLGNRPSLPYTTTSSTTALLPLITTSYDPQPLIISSLDPSITSNTAIRTSDGKHPVGLYPLIKGGPHCFFCPPGIGGLVLFGMNLPGVSKAAYPPAMAC